MRSIRTSWPEGKGEARKPIINAFGHRTSSKTGQIDALLTKGIMGSTVQKICEDLHVTEDYVNAHLKVLKKKEFLLEGVLMVDCLLISNEQTGRGFNPSLNP